MAGQMGVTQATGPLSDISKGVTSMASMLGGQVRCAPMWHGAARVAARIRCSAVQALRLW
jgi:hypothetical protein